MLKVQNVSKKYPGDIVALDNVSFTIEDNEMCYLTGHSGAGKSTLFRLILREEKPTDGKIIFNNLEISSLPYDYLDVYRQQIGVIFQDYKLIQTKNVFENVAFALEIIGVPQKEIEKRTNEALERVLLTQRMKLYPYQLSGGEQQRAAIARAIVNKPLFILADEPTGNLDSDTAMTIIDLLKEINKEGTEILIATHDFDLIKRVDGRILTLKNGKLLNE